MMAIEVLEPGLGCTVQDRGRPGYYHVGIPPSGAVDARSALAANLLVGNDPDAAFLECAYLGPRLRVDAPVVVAVTGADMPILVNGTSAAQWEALALHAGDELSFEFLRGGARVYLAFAGGIDVAPTLGSRSTYALGGFGGHEGRALEAGDVLQVGRPTRSARPGSRVPEALRPQFPKDIEIRVVLGLYDYRLSDAGLQTLVDTWWTLSPVADRTGFRYTGPTMEFRERVQPFGAGSDPSNIVDAGYPLGSIQVPGGAEPIVLHRDAVSGGGYAQVATVISADMDVVGQSSPGTRTRFRPVSLAVALDARAQASARRRELAVAIS